MLTEQQNNNGRAMKSLTCGNIGYAASLCGYWNFLAKSAGQQVRTAKATLE